MSHGQVLFVSVAPGLALILACGGLASCASDDGSTRAGPAQSADDRAPTDDDTDDGAAEGSDDGASVGAHAAESLEMPKTWDEVGDRLEFLCPGPLFTMETPSEVQIGGHTFARLGSTWKRTRAWEGPLVLGVLGAPKDASEATRENVRKAGKAFTKGGAHFVVVNGDLAEDDELKDVMRMLGEEIALPVLVHAGNIEWAGAFTLAYEVAARDHPHLINMNWVRDLDLGGVHVVSLPGYHDARFTRSGACRYADDDVTALRALVHELRAKGDRVVLTAHGPPRSRDYDAIDFAHEAGNVGDERLTAVLVEEDVRLGLFGHILEAGGRATSDLEAGTPVRFPVQEPVERLYVNAGSAGSYPWTMHGGQASEGIALIVRLDARGITAEKLKLR